MTWQVFTISCVDMTKERIEAKENNEPRRRRGGVMDEMTVQEAIRRLHKLDKWSGECDEDRYAILSLVEFIEVQAARVAERRKREK